MGSSSALISKIVKNWRETPRSSYSLNVHKLRSRRRSLIINTNLVLSPLVDINWCAVRCYVYTSYREIGPFVSFRKLNGFSRSAVSTIVEKWREHPPASYSLKIQSFSQLENSTAFSDHKFQSRIFSSGGYKWRLIVYPKENQNDNGSGFISMYVEIDSKSLMVFTPPTEIFAELRFYIYNKKGNKYFTIQDVEVKRFNALKTVWGLVQVLPYDTFNNPENGYVFEGGQCEFGVDVIVAPPLTNWEIHSFNMKLSHPNKFSWALKNFSELKENILRLDIFSMGGRKWFLRLYPKGDSKADGKWLSIYLEMAASDALKEDEKIFVQAKLQVLDPLGSNHIEFQMNVWYEVIGVGMSLCL